MKISEIKIGPRIRKELGDLKPLIKSIDEYGLLQPICLRERDDMLLDGLRRIEALKLLDIEEIPDSWVHRIPIDRIMRGELDANTIRKDFTVSERVVAIETVLRDEKEKARKRQGLRTDLGLSENISECDWGEAKDKAVKRFGWSRPTFEKARTIRDAARQNPEKYEGILKAVDAGRKSVNRGVKDIQRIKAQQKQIEGVPLPAGVFDIIYSDPPWRYDYQGSTRGKAEMHYPTMPTQDIMDMPVPEMVADDAILFLWVTNPMLKDGRKVAEAWGFDYKTNFVWVKDKIGTGFYNRAQHELLFICRRGNLKAPADANRFPSVIQAPRTEHSRKPEVVYGMIEKMYPNRKYIELFARRVEPRERWTYWGNEIEKTRILVASMEIYCQFIVIFG